MSKQKPIMGEPNVNHPLKEEIAGKNVWKFLQKNIGNYIFGGHTYFSIIAPEDIPAHTTSSLRGMLEGKLLTWVESAMDGRRAEASKEIVRNILSEEFNRSRDNFEEMATDLMMESPVIGGSE